MFDDEVMLARMSRGVREAAGKFAREMEAFSGVVQARVFGADGLAQGMPFLWRALDPDVAPYSVSI